MLLTEREYRWQLATHMTSYRFQKTRLVDGLFLREAVTQDLHGCMEKTDSNPLKGKSKDSANSLFS